jgi:hypothetical protein
MSILSISIFITFHQLRALVVDGWLSVMNSRVIDEINVSCM